MAVLVKTAVEAGSRNKAAGTKGPELSSEDLERQRMQAWTQAGWGPEKSAWLQVCMSKPQVLKRKVNRAEV